MKTGMTLEQIARRIAFSHSTVRQESLAIYRFFGVSNRQAALEEAENLGYLDN